MREALASLTTRGRAFVAAGLTALLCAVVLAQDDLVRVGALLLAVPLVAAFVVGRSRYRLGLVRSLWPPQVTAGQEARVRLDLTNDGRVPTGLLLLEDHVPYVLGSRPRFVVDQMRPRRRRTIEYPLRSEVRGRYVLGPLTVRVTDPFGMVELNRRFSSTSPLVVVPQTVPLPLVPLSGAWTGSGDNRPRAFATGSAEDVTVRDYRRGDDLRRVHWRSSARVGELMVRREEQPWQSRATLFLDNRERSHRGHGAGASLERAVSVAASIAVHLVQRGYVVRLVTAAGDEQGGSWHERGADSAEAAPLLEALAVVNPVTRPDLDTRWLQDPGHSGLLVAVTGSVAEHDQPAFSRMRHTSATTMAIALDVQQWAGPDERHRAGELRGVDRLRALGWQAASLERDTRLAAAWQDLGMSSGRAAQRMPGADTPAAPVVGVRPRTAR